MAGRNIIAVIGLSAVVGGVAALIAAAGLWADGVQRDGLPVIGFLATQPAALSIRYLTAFRCGLHQAGYVEGREVRIEYRWAEGDSVKANMMASELAARPVAVIAATGGLHSGRARPEAMSIIPELFIAGVDPRQPGSAAGPGRNIAGVRLDVTGVIAKRLELLKELMPSGGKAAMLVRPLGPAAGDRRSQLSQSERTLAGRWGAATLAIDHEEDFDRELDPMLARAVEDGVRGFVVSADAFLTSRREKIVALAAKHGLVALYPWRPYVEAGGLASYGPDLLDVYRQVGLYTGQLLKGARPGSLPVVAPRKWDLVINRRTAASLKLDIAPWIIARANEVVD